MELRRNPLGFLEVYPKPSEEELQTHYNNKYFGADRGQYSATYTDEEIRNKYYQCDEILHFAPAGGRTLLDIGCGEGFTLSYFVERGWEVEGVDFTHEGVTRFFASLASKVRVGSLFHIIDEIRAAGSKYDLVVCNNVLEHVGDPNKLMTSIKDLLNDGGVCRVVVPNDDSIMHAEIVRRGIAPPDFWVCPPDHLSYFNAESLRRILEKSGFRIRDLLGDFPIELFLFNPDSNYQQERAKGKACHFARVRVENMLAADSIEKWLAFRRGCAESGLGRTLVAYCTV